MIYFRRLLRRARNDNYFNLTFFTFFFLFVPFFVRAESSFATEIQNISSQYSRYLDSVWTGGGWNYLVSSSQYREVDKNSENNLRTQTTFAGAYLNRDDEESKDKVRKALTNVLIELPKHQANYIIQNGKELSTRSFHDAIGLYLALQVVQDRPELFVWTERFEMLYNAKRLFPWVLKAPDTENRALLGAAYGLAVLKHPLLSFTEQEKREYETLIRGKVQEGLKSVGRDFVYREGKPRRFSLHYHLVSANMLFYLCREFPDQKYCSTAEKMTKVVRTWYPKGRLSWRGSSRPRGIGLQTVLLRALAERSLGNPKWQKYWEAEKVGRGFIDPKNPDRLVWRDEGDKTLNDDYSFVSIAEVLMRESQ